MQLFIIYGIGSAKPTAEELSQVKHYLVDEIDPREKFSVAQYQKLAKAAIREIFDKGRVPCNFRRYRPLYQFTDV